MEKEEIIKIGEKIKQQYIKEIEKYVAYKNILGVKNSLKGRLLDDRNIVREALNKERDQVEFDFYDNLEEDEPEEDTEDFFTHIDKSRLSESKKISLNEINLDLQATTLDDEIRQEIIKAVEKISISNDLLQKEQIVGRVIDIILEQIELDNIYEENDLFEAVNETNFIDIILNVINFSNVLNESAYPTDWAKINIEELAKYFAIDNVEMEPEYLKKIYPIYYRKCKTPISKLGVKLSYYKTILFEMLYGSKIDISKDEADEILKIAIFQKCLQENWQVFTIANGPFYREFNDYIVNEEKLPDHILESDIDIINYLFEENLIGEAISKISFDYPEENRILKEFKKINNIYKLEGLAKNGMLKEFVDKKKNQILERRIRENNNIPIDVFCAIIINSCASEDSIRRMIEKIDINKRELNSQELFDLISIGIYTENKFYDQIDKSELSDIGQILYQGIKNNKGKESIDISRQLKGKLKGMFNMLDELLPRNTMNFENEDVEL